MDRATSRLVARTAAKEALTNLAPCFTGIGTLERHRKRIGLVRDRLHAACVCFEAGDSCEQDEDIYLVLFDALAYVTTAAGVKPIRRGPIEKAADELRKLTGI